MFRFPSFCRLFFVNPSPLVVKKVPGSIPGRFSCVTVRGVLIPTYDVVRSCRCLEVSVNGWDHILVVYATLRVCWPFSVVVLIAFVSPTPLRDLIGVFRAGYQAHADGLAIPSCMRQTASELTIIIRFRAS